MANRSVLGLEEEKQEYQKKKGGFNPLVLILTILILGGGAFGYYKFIRKDAKQEEKTIKVEEETQESRYKNITDPSEKKDINGIKTKEKEEIIIEEPELSDEEKELQLVDQLIGQINEGDMNGDELLKKETTKKEIPNIDYDTIEYNKIQNGLFTVTKIDVEEKESNNEILVQQLLTGQISGLYGEYTIYFPKSLGVMEGTKIPIKYRTAKYSDNSSLIIVSDLIVDYKQIALE